MNKNLLDKKLQLKKQTDNCVFVTYDLKFVKSIIKYIHKSYMIYKHSDLFNLQWYR